jgi:hypothetical protein
MSKPARTENRWSPRQAMELEVTLHATTQGAFTGKTSNISIGGMFIETDMPRLFRDDEVLITIPNRRSGDQPLCRIPGLVVWSDGNGIGLMFSRLDPGAIRALRELLYPTPEVGQESNRAGTTHLKGLT